MKKTLSTLTAVFCLAVANQALALPLVTLTPAAQTFPVGEERSVTVGLTLDPNEALDQFVFYMDFNDVILDFVNLSFSSDILNAGYSSAADYSAFPGTVSFSGGWTGTDLFDTFDVATLTFRGDMVGVSDLLLTGDIITYNDIGGTYSDPPFTVTANATMAPVPEPATFLLFGSGLAGLRLIRRKTAAKQAA